MYGGSAMPILTHHPSPTRQRSRKRPFTVGKVLNQVRSCLEGNFLPLLVRGEVRDRRRPRNGNLYLTLRDRGARLRVVVFASTLARMEHEVADGQEALVWGRITAYPAAGDVQLVAEHIEPAGLGPQWAQRERLRKRLAAEGLFAAERKRPLPFLPQQVGVVTSATGSALRDVLTTLERRFPAVRVVLAPSRVHGAIAAADIAETIRRVDRAGCDLLLLVRGGGSQEDLAGFDQESVVRAIAGCKTPLVCGVGHEDDVTLADLVADRRAPTPTGAAELAVPARTELLRQLELFERRLTRACAGTLHAAGTRLEIAGRRLALCAPRAKLRRWEQQLDALQPRLVRAAEQLVARRERALAAQAGQLESLSPLRVLARGYSLTTDEAGDLIQDAGALAPGDTVRTSLARGAFLARVVATEPAEEQA